MGGVGTMLLGGAGAQDAEAKAAHRREETFGKRKPRVTKKIIVAGAGIAGLCCAYELTRLGHEVVVLEAQGRSSGTVLSVHDGLADGLYADFGAEHFHHRGYEKYWEYVKEFNLEVLPYYHRVNRLTSIDGKWYTDEQQTERELSLAKKAGGFNAREQKYLSSHPLSQLQFLFMEPYLQKFTDNYQPYGIGLDKLENVPMSEIYKKEGASNAALQLLGGERASALYTIWQAYITKTRGKQPMPADNIESFRLKGGNQVLPNEFARRLGQRVQLDCQVLEVEHGQTSVTVTYREFGEIKKMSADFLVFCLRPPSLRKIPVTPELPPEKRFAFDNLSFIQSQRIVLQSRSKFWQDDDVSINLYFDHPQLKEIWQVADEVDTPRAALMLKTYGGVSPLRAVEAFKDLYPGKRSSINIEQMLVKDFSADPFAQGCERIGFSGVGEMSKFWPHLMTPVGRIHFAGGHTDNRAWGMEASVNSANRVARQIDES